MVTLQGLRAVAEKYSAGETRVSLVAQGLSVQLRRGSIVFYWAFLEDIDDERLLELIKSKKRKMLAAQTRRDRQLAGESVSYAEV